MEFGSLVSISLGAGVDASVIAERDGGNCTIRCMHVGGKGRVQKGHRSLNRLELPRTDPMRLRCQWQSKMDVLLFYRIWDMGLYSM